MAQESLDSEVTSKKIEHQDGDEKTNPTERLGMIKSKHKIVSRYLGGHIGSCHDLCKYGIKHDVEAKPWNTAQKKLATKGRKIKVPEENVISTGNGKSTSSSSKASPKFGKLNCPVLIKEVIASSSNEEIISLKKNIPPFEETDVPTEHTGIELNQAPLEPPSFPVEECSNGHGNIEKVKGKTPFGSNSRKKSESRSKQIRTTSIIGKKTLVPPSNSLASKHHVKKSSSLSTKTAKNLKRVRSLENRKKVRKVKPKIASNENLPEKILHIIEPTLETKAVVEPTLACDNTSLSSVSPSLSGDKNLNRADEQIGKSGLPATKRKSTRHAGHRIHPTISAAPSPLSSVSKGKRSIRHKMQSSSSSPPSRSASAISTPKSSPGRQNVATSKYKKAGQGHPGENVKVGYKIRTRSTIVEGGNKVIPARKLSFRRGKMIELQPQSNNVPRRLKFRPVRLLSDAQRELRNNNNNRKGINRRKEVDDGALNDVKVKLLKVVPRLLTVEGSKRRSFKRKGADGCKLDGSKSGSEQVVLRHQNEEGNKVTRRLYNNVIEETASKLAELRKSKVKALVGAFETVISLDSPREATPLEITTAC
ncbi:hypothetical protein L6164_014531 [Bauhinia variegata]|uniref:Uncharacterized protein n=1 Tax=Bauhinia variegata TaxID=167791 RepID=A0ACB9NHM6_BAUVA|nr:hypothetical protein L6164_014531 [Bauhinia variegata]